MKITIKSGKTTMKATVGGTLEKKLAFLTALTGVDWSEANKAAPPVEKLTERGNGER